MGWQSVLNRVRNEAPPFNDYMLKQCRAEHVNSSVEYIDITFKEAMKLFPPSIEYQGYKVLSPEKQIEYMMDNKVTKGKFNVQRNELQLVEFRFMYRHVTDEGDRINHPVVTHIFLPYLHHGSIVVNDTANYIQLAIIERVIYRMVDCVIIKVMRSPIHFWRTEQFTYTDINGKSFYDAIITVKVHQRNTVRSKNDIKTALLLYPLSTRGFNGTLDVFGIPREFMYFTRTKDEREEYFTFTCRDGIYLMVHNSIMTNITHRRIVASLIYMLSYFDFYQFEDIYDFKENPFVNGNMWQIILGKTIFGMKYDNALACSQAQAHLNSSISYLDPLTQRELNRQGIVCNDIFELFVEVFKNMDPWLIIHAPNDLYEKKLGISELLMSEIVKVIFKKCYEVITNEKKLNIAVVNSLFRISSKKIATIYNSQLVRSANIYGDNELLSLMGKKVRQPANQDGTKKANANLITAREHRFHPSFVVVESALSVLSNRPGVSGSINPYASISPVDLYFQRPNYADAIDEIYPYLPSR